MILTVKGKAEAVVVDAVMCRDIAQHLETIAAIRRGLTQAKQGTGRPVDDVLNDLEREA